MARKSQVACVSVLVLLLIICVVEGGWVKDIRQSLANNTCIVVGDKFSGVIKQSPNLTDASSECGIRDRSCVVFLRKLKATAQHEPCPKPRTHLLVMGDGSQLFVVGRGYTRQTNLRLCLLYGERCKKHNRTSSQGQCRFGLVETNTTCKSATYDSKFCNSVTCFKTRYFVNVTESGVKCSRCTKEIKMETLPTSQEGTIEPAKAKDLLKNMSSLLSDFDGSPTVVSAGPDVSGVIVGQKVEKLENLEEKVLSWAGPDSSVDIIDGGDSGAPSLRSVKVSKEAFHKACNRFTRTTFAAAVRFINFAKDERNSNVLGNEVFAIEMGRVVDNLTDNIVISFRNVAEEGDMQCKSWNGEGKLPNWTDNGCVTKRDGDNVQCHCSHLTFFAVLLSPPDVKISGSHLSVLTTITSAGCGLSMVFLSVAIFMHCLLRRTKASAAAKILIHLMVAIFLLNLTFVSNKWVAGTNNLACCWIIAALMHYFLLSSFTWFAAAALHICLQIYMAGRVTFRHYLTKVAVASWGLPGIVIIVLLSTKKYGEQVIVTDDRNVTMCWIVDDHVHYIVNIGYYALVFLFTFSTFVIILRWICCGTRFRRASAQTSQNGRSIVAIFGLCALLGITWGLAFFAHGVLRVPSYYLFCILVSLQGVFLFVHYHRTARETTDDHNGSSSSSSSTEKTTAIYPNPYSDPQKQTLGLTMQENG